MNRKKVLLAVLILLFLVTAVISFFRMPKQKRVDKLKYQPGAVAVAPRAAPKGTSAEKPAASASAPSPAPTASAPPRLPTPPAAPAASPAAAAPTQGKVRLDLLANARPFAGFRRNLFKPLFGVEAPVKPSAPGPVKLPKPSLIPAPPGPTLPATPATPPPPPLPPPIPPVQRDMARFTFMGFLQKDGQKTIFLSKDKDIFLVKRGDKLAGKYEAANITDEALTIRVLEDGGEIVIPLVENKPLRPMKK